MRSLLITWEAICLSGSVFGVCLFPISAFHRFVCVVWLPFAFRGVRGRFGRAPGGLCPFHQREVHAVRQFRVLREDPDRDVERPGRVGRRSDAVEGQRALLTFELQFALGDHLDVVAVVDLVGHDHFHADVVRFQPVDVDHHLDVVGVPDEDRLFAHVDALCADDAHLVPRVAHLAFPGRDFARHAEVVGTHVRVAFVKFAVETFLVVGEHAVRSARYRRGRP